jgi:hypothetical protein
LDRPRDRKSSGIALSLASPGFRCERQVANHFLNKDSRKVCQCSKQNCTLLVFLRTSAHRTLGVMCDCQIPRMAYPLPLQPDKNSANFPHWKMLIVEERISYQTRQLLGSLHLKNPRTKTPLVYEVRGMTTYALMLPKMPRASQFCTSKS